MDVMAGADRWLLPPTQWSRANQFRQMIFVGKVSEVAPMAPEEPNSAYRASQVRDS